MAAARSSVAACRNAYPEDLSAGSGQQDVDDYCMRLAKRNLTYTVLNYEVNNRLKFQLHSAQRCLRNGIIAIIIAGGLSPWHCIRPRPARPARRCGGHPGPGWVRARLRRWPHDRRSCWRHRQALRDPPGRSPPLTGPEDVAGRGERTELPYDSLPRHGPSRPARGGAPGATSPVCAGR